MQRKKPDVDVILDVLLAVEEARPEDAFVKSILQQYRERGGLSKKQLEGLYGKAQRVKMVTGAKLATLEAIILKKHTKHRSELPAPTPLFSKDEKIGQQINDILAKFPQHKRVLFLKSKYDNNEIITPAEKTELKNFLKLLK
jgi:hypothetical protein